MGSDHLNLHPLVVVCNISETFYPFLKRASQDQKRTRLILGEQYRGDRALMWLARAKLVVASHAIPHAEDFYRQFGYQCTQAVAPQQPSPWLCRDILNEPALLQALVDYAGESQTLQLIPYAATADFYRLVDVLRHQHGLQVLTPESPPADKLWVRDYIDTKLGFHVLVSQWLADSDRVLPRRIVCQDLETAVEAVGWFGDRGLDCLIKADDGENGLGNYRIDAGSFASINGIREHLQRHAFLDCEELIVEQFVHSKELLSPSLEMFVPASGEGEPRITYLSRQIFRGPGDFCGVLVDRALLEAAWYGPLAHSGMVIAHHLQEMGYTGHFDLDAVVDDHNQLYLLEVNSRRTGGTHVHEFGHTYFGPDYLQEVVLLSHDSLSAADIRDYAELRYALAPYLYPDHADGCGLVISVTSSLADGEFGAVFVAHTAEEALALQEEAEHFLQQRAASRPSVN